VLIGIDMLGVQTAESRDRESGRFGRQLVENLLAADSTHRFILYTHEGFPTDRIPIDRKALRVSLAPISGGSTRLRPTLQRVIDQNPDGLDWLILLDPFEPNYGGIPPESPLNALKIASIVLDLAPNLADDRRLAPLRRHDAIFAVSEATANESRRRFGSASRRVSTLGLACDPGFAGDQSSEPLTRVSGEELGRLGITGPFLFANLVGGNERANLAGIIESFHQLPFEQRRRHQLVVAGLVSDPWSVVAYLHDRGCAESLLMIGEVDESTLKTLYHRCSAFVSPSIEEGSGLTLVEAMLCGAPVIAGRTGAQPEIVGDAGLVVDPFDPTEIATELARLLSDADLAHQLSCRAMARGQLFGWEPVIRGLLASLEAELAPVSGHRLRIDQAHVARQRIALFPEVPKVELKPVDLGDQVPTAWSDSYQVDLYLEPEHARLLDGIPSNLGGFDARQFERNDRILGYHAVVYRLGSIDDLEARLNRMRTRPGLILFRDDAIFDQIGLDGDEALSALILVKFRELFLTASRLGVRTSRQAARIKACLPEFAGQIVVFPIIGSNDSTMPGAFVREELDRCAAELPRGPGRRTRRPGVASRSLGSSTPHSLRSSFHDDEVASRSRERK
jgi:glycosyltransferase involved in cell wall biosynthesis